MKLPRAGIKIDIIVDTCLFTSPDKSATCIEFLRKGTKVVIIGGYTINEQGIWVVVSTIGLGVGYVDLEAISQEFNNN